MDKKECGCAEGKCMCGGAMGHMHGCHSRHHLVKVILKLVIIIIIFWCGYQLGMMTGYIKAEYGGGMMRGGFGHVQMMNGGTTVTPVAPVPAQ